MVTVIYWHAATDISADRSHMHPRDIFCVNDRVQVHGTQTRHHGRIARINTIGDRRLSVTFEDGLSGKFIEYTDAVLIPERGDDTTVSTPTRLQPSVPRTSRTVRSSPQTSRTVRAVYGDSTTDMGPYEHTFGDPIPRQRRPGRSQGQAVQSATAPAVIRHIHGTSFDDKNITMYLMPNGDVPLIQMCQTIVWQIVNQRTTMMTSPSYATRMGCEHINLLQLRVTVWLLIEYSTSFLLLLLH
jgi:hypothetical protein